MRSTLCSKLTSKGQVTIPEEIRSNLHLHPGDQLEWRLMGGGVLEVRRVGSSLDDLVGCLGAPARTVTDEQMSEAIRQRFRAGDAW